MLIIYLRAEAIVFTTSESNPEDNEVLCFITSSMPSKIKDLLYPSLKTAFRDQRDFTPVNSQDQLFEGKAMHNMVFCRYNQKIKNLVT